MKKSAVGNNILPLLLSHSQKDFDIHPIGINLIKLPNPFKGEPKVDILQTDQDFVVKVIRPESPEWRWIVTQSGSYTIYFESNHKGFSYGTGVVELEEAAAKE